MLLMYELSQGAKQPMLVFIALKNAMVLLVFLMQSALLYGVNICSVV